MKEIKQIREFLNQWRERAYNFYTECLKEYKTKKYEIWKEYESNRDNNSYNSKMKELANETPSLIRTDLSQRGPEDALEHLNKILDREVESKYKQFMNRINKIDGDIEDTANLHIGVNGEINGYIKCKSCNIKITTIYAGGYNIQCLHYRVLVKKF